MCRCDRMSALSKWATIIWIPNWVRKSRILLLFSYDKYFILKVGQRGKDGRRKLLEGTVGLHNSFLAYNVLFTWSWNAWQTYIHRKATLKRVVVLLHNPLRLRLIQALSKLAESMMSVRLVTKDALIFVAIKAVDHTVSQWVQQKQSDMDEKSDRLNSI